MQKRKIKVSYCRAIYRHTVRRAFASSCGAERWPMPRARAGNDCEYICASICLHGYQKVSCTEPPSTEVSCAVQRPSEAVTGETPSQKSPAGRQRDDSEDAINGLTRKISDPASTSSAVTSRFLLARPTTCC
eukprot:6211843-Pleurochrysis_carterae.AAC.2